MVTILCKVLYINICTHANLCSNAPYTREDMPLDSLLLAPLILRCKTVNDHFYIPHTNLSQTALIIFELIDVRCCNEFFLGLVK